MNYVILFLPAILSLIVLMVSLRYYKDKSGLIIASAMTMVLFLWIKDKLTVAPAVNALFLTFTLTYLVISFVLMMKKNKDEK